MTPQPRETFNLEVSILGEVGPFIHANGNEISDAVRKVVWLEKLDFCR